MNEDVVIGAVMGAALVFIMFSMGLVLTAADFRRVVRFPRGVFLGVGAQMILLPLIALGSVYAFDMPTAAAVGILVVAICPGGPVSNFFAHISGGDGALSVTLTLMSTALSLVTLPAFFAWTPMSEVAHGVETPVGFIIKSMLIGVVAPIAAGMVVRARWPAYAARMARYLEKAGLSLIFVVLSLILYRNRAFYADVTATLLMAVAVVNVGGMIGGYLLGGAAGHTRPARITYTYEVGLQNVPLASVLAFGLFAASDGRALAIILAVIGLYAVVSIMSALGSVFLFKQVVPVGVGEAPVAANPK